jgi:hypothetical protein
MEHNLEWALERVKGFDPGKGLMPYQKGMIAMAHEIERLRAELASIGEYDCPGGMHPKHCLGCAACDANKALENHGPVAPAGVGVIDLAGRSSVSASESQT